MAFVQYIVLKILQAGQQGGELLISGGFTMASVARCSPWMNRKELVPLPRAAPRGAQSGGAAGLQNWAGQVQWRAGRQSAEQVKFGRLS